MLSKLLNLGQKSSLPKSDSQTFWVLWFFVATRFAALFLSYPTITDLDGYEYYFDRIFLDHLLPYRDFNFEYPPLTLALICAPALLVGEVLNSFNITTFGFSCLIIDIATLVLCRRFCQKKLGMNREQTNYATMIYSLFGLLMFKTLYHRLDIGVAMFLVISLLLFDATNSRLKFSFFANAFLGFFYKITPALNLPCAIILKSFSQEKDLKKVLTKIFLSGFAFFVGAALVIYFLEIFTEKKFIQNILLHQRRGLHVESLLGSLILFKNLIANQVSPIYPSCSWNVMVEKWLEIFAKLLGPLMLLALHGGLLLSLARLHKKNTISNEQFLEITLIVILTFISFLHVFSPQFLIWIMPLAAIYMAQNRSVKLLLLFSFPFLATSFFFPMSYFSLINEEPIMVCTLLLRNLSVVFITLMLTKNFFKKLHQNDR